MSKKIILTEGVDPKTMMFSPAIAVGSLAFSSGSAGIDKQGKIPGPDIESQARQAMENLGEALTAAGAGWQDVVKVTCYLTHASRDFQGWNKVWKEYFPQSPPARTTIGIGLLRDEWLLEVKLVFIVSKDGKEVILPQGVDASKIVIAPGVRVGETLYISGSAGAKNGKLPGDDIESQARQAMENLGVVLKAAGSSWDKVFKVNCYLTQAQRDFQGWNKVWKEYFPQNPPARTTVEAGIAMEGALIEVDITANAEGKEVILPQGVDASKIVIAPGVRVGETLYLSGSAGAKNGKLPGDDIESQARQAMENLGVVLKAAGGSWDNVVKVTCYLTQAQRDVQGWNKVWKEYFPQNPPARTTVEAGIAMEGALIEVDIIAAL